MVRHRLIRLPIPPMAPTTKAGRKGPGKFEILNRTCVEVRDSTVASRCVVFRGHRPLPVVQLILYFPAL